MKPSVIAKEQIQEEQEQIIIDHAKELLGQMGEQEAVIRKAQERIDLIDKDLVAIDAGDKQTLQKVLDYHYMRHGKQMLQVSGTIHTSRLAAGSISANVSN